MRTNKKIFPYLRHYSWIMAKWFGICLVIGFVLAILAAGQDGASVVFVILAVYVGLLGGTLHNLVLAYRENKWRHMLPILTIGLVLLGFWRLSVLQDAACHTQPEVARIAIVRYLEKTGRSATGLEQSPYDHESCIFYYRYKGKGDTLDIIYDRGQVGTMPLEE